MDSTSSSSMSLKRSDRKNVKLSDKIAEENTENVPENDWKILQEAEKSLRISRRTTLRMP